MRVALSDEIERFLRRRLSDTIRRAYRADCATSPSGTARRPDREGRRTRAVGVHGRPRASRPGGKLAPATISRRLAAVRGLIRSRSGRAPCPIRFAPRVPGGCPTRRRARSRSCSTALAARSRSLCATARCSSSSTRRPAQRRGRGARPRGRGLRAGARARPHGKGAKDRIVPLGEEAAHWVARYLRESRPELARGAEDAFFLSARGRRLDTSTLRRLLPRTRTGCVTRSRRTCSRAAPTCA